MNEWRRASPSTQQGSAGFRPDPCALCMRRAQTTHDYRAAFTGLPSRSAATTRQRGAGEYSKPGGSVFCARCLAFEQGVADSTLVGLKKPDELLALREYAQGTPTAKMYLEGLWHGAAAVEG